MTLEYVRAHPERMTIALGASTLVLAIALVAVIVRLEQTRDDLRRVEFGAALLTVGSQALQEEIDASGTDGLGSAIAALEALRDEPLEFTTSLRDTVEVDTTIEVNETVTVPIEITVPIDQTLATSVEVAGPFGVAVPLDVEIPLRLDVPIEADVQLPLDTTLPVRASVPIELDAPVSIELDGTPLGHLVDVLIELLGTLRVVLPSGAS